MIFYWDPFAVVVAVGSCAWLYACGWRRLGFCGMVAVFTGWMQWGMYTNYPLPAGDGWWVAFVAALVVFVCGLRRGSPPGP